MLIFGRPAWTLSDVIGLTHPEYIADVQNSEYTYDRHTDDTSNSYINTNNVYYWTADTKNQNGMAFKYDLLGSEYYNGGTVLCENSRGYMVYESTLANQSYTTGTAYGHYAHTEAKFSGLSINLTTGTMSVSGALNISYMTDTGVTFSF